MIKKFIVLSVLFLFLFIVPVWALDLTFLFDIGNLGFPASRPPTDTSFSGNDISWGITASLSQEFEDNFIANFGFTQDTILRSLFYTAVGFQDETVSLSFGTMFSVLNSPVYMIKPGILSNVRFNAADWLFMRLFGNASIGGQGNGASYLFFEDSGFELGFPGEIVTFSLLYSMQRFGYYESQEIIDSATRYSAVFSISKASVPFIIKIDFSYLSIGKQFIGSALTHTIGSIVLTTGTDVQIADFLSLILDIESSIFTFGGDELLLTDIDSNKYYFRIRSGVRLSL